MKAWLPVLYGLIGAYASYLLTKAIRQEIENFKEKDDYEKILKYGRSIRALSIFVLAVAGFMLYITFLSSNKHKLVAYIVSGFFCLGALSFVLEAFLVNIRFDYDLIYTFSPWRRPRIIPWFAIVGFSASNFFQWTVFMTDRFGKIRISRYFNNDGAFGVYFFLKNDEYLTKIHQIASKIAEDFKTEMLDLLEKAVKREPGSKQNLLDCIIRYEIRIDKEDSGAFNVLPPRKEYEFMRTCAALWAQVWSKLDSKDTPFPRTVEEMLDDEWIIPIYPRFHVKPGESYGEELRPRRIRGIPEEDLKSGISKRKQQLFAPKPKLSDKFSDEELF